jgi:hypothetical protein
MLKFSFFFSSVIFLLTGCKTSGVLIEGKLQRISGNYMPSPDLPTEPPPGYSGKVYFFEPVLSSQASLTRNPGMYSMKGRIPVAVAVADSSGHFKVRLKAGRYSVLIGRNDLFYSNITDLDGTINPYVVMRGKLSPLLLRADWDAVY